MDISIEDKIPQSAGMTLKAFWKLKVKETLRNIYGNDGIKEDGINRYLDEILAKSHNPIAKMRNIYEERFWEMELNDVLIMVQDNHLIIGANGTFTVRHYVRMSELSELLILWLKQRSDLKKLLLIAEEANDVGGIRKNDNLQNTRKENNNSSYGITTMPGGFFYSPDSSSMITLQARELISEMLWTVEKLLGNNMVFKDMNEFYSYINEILNLPMSIDFITKYNIVVPTFEQIKVRMIELLAFVPEHEREVAKNSKSLYLLALNISKDPSKAISFYYRYNLYKFLSMNVDVMDIINRIMKAKLEFNSPLREVMVKNESCAYIPKLDELCEVLQHFVTTPIGTYDRVDKYVNRGRYIVPISDTDSIIVRLDEWTGFVASVGDYKFDTYYDESDVYRAANIMNYISTDICNFMGRNMARNCYVPKEHCQRIALKNEFFFKSLILYPFIKKNYSAWTVLREGVIVNKVNNTGLALTGSNMNKFVSKTMNDIIFKEIHSVKDVSVMRIMKRIYDLESSIRNSLLSGDVTFGITSSYKNSMKSNPYSDSRIRGVEIWNHLYPSNKIEPYNKIYVFKTKVEKVADLYMVKDDSVRHALKAAIFDLPPHPDLVKFGLRTVAVPDTLEKLPPWLVDIIDVNNIVERHVNSLTSLLPSIGIYINRVNSSRNHISPLTIL